MNYIFVSLKQSVCKVYQNRSFFEITRIIGIHYCNGTKLCCTRSSTANWLKFGNVPFPFSLLRALEHIYPAIKNVVFVITFSGSSCLCFASAQHLKASTCGGNIV